MHNDSKTALARPGDANDDAVLANGTEVSPLLESASTKAQGYSKQPYNSQSPAWNTTQATIVYLTCLIEGAAVLLAWNALIVAFAYFKSRLAGSAFSSNFGSFLTTIYCFVNLLALARANRTQHHASPSQRVYTSTAAISALLLITCLSTRMSSIDANVFFAGLMMLTIAMAIASSYLQNATIALSSIFGPTYLQGVLGGQAAIGVAVSIVQFIIAYSSSVTDSQHVRNEDEYANSLKRSAFVLFLVATIFSLVALAAHHSLTRLSFSRPIIQAAENLSHSGKEASLQSMRRAELKIRRLGLAVCFVFVVTLAVFPSITSAILSVNDRSDTEGPIIYNAALFVPIGFIVFNVGDWIGRALPHIESLTFRSERALVLASLARLTFIPLFLLCNIDADGQSQGRPLINSDLAYILILLAFAITNGYVSTLIMIAGVSQPSLCEGEVDLAATCLTFYLVLGLTLGSFASFAVRASICNCNPFTS